MLIGHDGGVSDCCWSYDDKYLISASDDALLFLWNAETGTCLRKYSGNSCPIICCCINKAGNLIAGGSSDERVKIWEVKSSKCLVTLPAHSDPVICVSFNLDSTLLISSSYENASRIWDVRTGACLKTIVFKGDFPIAMFVQFSPGDNFILFSLQGRQYAYDYLSDLLYFSRETIQSNKLQQSFIKDLQEILPSGFSYDISNIFERSVIVLKQKRGIPKQNMIEQGNSNEVDAKICVNIKLACAVTCARIVACVSEHSCYGVQIFEECLPSID